MKNFTHDNWRKKRSYLIVFFTILGLSFSSLSQGVENSDEPSSYPRIIAEKSPLYPKIFFNYSYVNALGNYRQFQHQEGIDFPAMRLGFSFEVGNIFWINRLKMNPDSRFKFGIYVVYHELGFLFGKTKTNSNTMHNSSGVKAGPLLSYNPMGALLVNIKATLEPTAIIQGEYLFFRGGVGFDVRYKNIFMGLNFSFGRTGRYGDLSDYSEGIPYFNTSVMRLSFGLNLKPLKEKR